jgi:hypothetical protein
MWNTWDQSKNFLNIREFAEKSQWQETEKAGGIQSARVELSL